MELSGCQSSKMTRQFKFVWNRKFQFDGASNYNFTNGLKLVINKEGENNRKGYFLPLSV